jgi:DNA polymerase
MTTAPADIVLDFETASLLDLRKVGLYRYAQSSQTFILCAAWMDLNSGVMETWKVGDGPATLDRLRARIRAGAIIHAHNAEFEWQILTNKLPEAKVKLEQMRCTMAQAMYWGLPASLEAVGEALKLPPTLRKDTDGHANMMRMNRPRAIKNGLPTWWHEDEPKRLDDLLAYCMQDVIAEAAILKRLPELPRSELALWQINCLMNARGVGIDEQLVDNMMEVADKEKTRLDAQLSALTNGEVTATTQVGKLSKWLSKQLPWMEVTLAKDELQKTLPYLEGPALAAAEVRLEAAKSSTSKLQRTRDVTGGQGVARGLIQYYGASRTGRYSGKLCQPHNYPRGTLKKGDAEQAVEALRKGPAETNYFCTLGGYKPLDVISSSLRGTFIPLPGYTHFAVGDFSQIEARVLAWLAGQDDILEVFARGEDVYTYAAKKIGSDDRQLGKVMTLALGFGMGPDKFIESAATYGISIDLGDAGEIVYNWREANANIQAFWYAVERAVIATLTDKRPRTVGRVKFRMIDGRHLVIELPSQRWLVYRDAEMRNTSNFSGGASVGHNAKRKADKPFITFMGVLQPSGKWGRDQTYGGKLVENITQAVARDVMARALAVVTLKHRDKLSPVLTVHDEIVTMFNKNTISEADAAALLNDIMCADTGWSDGLPTAAGVYTAERYRK